MEKIVRLAWFSDPIEAAGEESPGRSGISAFISGDIAAARLPGWQRVCQDRTVCAAVVLQRAFSVLEKIQTEEYHQDAETVRHRGKRLASRRSTST